MFPYDSKLQEAVAQAPQTIPDVMATMQAIDAICADGDGLKWFNWLYLQVTSAVEQRVAQGGFHDLKWLAELDVQFAKLYFGALGSWLSGKGAPGCWTALFERRAQASIARIQFALAGINAHINHDLAIALVATCQATGTAPTYGSVQYQDYTAVNGTLDGLVDLAKKTLMVRLLGDALPPVSHLEDTVASWNVEAAREAAWVNAEVLWTLRSFPGMRSRYLARLDGITALAGKALLVPVPAVAAVVGA
jgi:hypothetical protein